MRNFTTEFMKQYSGRVCLEISGTPPSVKDNKLETKVLSILEEIDTSVDPGVVVDCHCLPSKGNLKKLILKLNHHKNPNKEEEEEEKKKKRKERKTSIPKQ